jgi:hypothetical protein
MRAIRNAYKHVVGKAEGKSVLGRPGHKHEYNIKCDLKEMAWESVDWIHEAYTKKERKKVRKKLALESCNIVINEQNECSF